MNKYVTNLHLFSQKLCAILIDKKMIDKNGNPDPIELHNLLYPKDLITQNDIEKFGRSYFTEKTRKERNWINGANCPRTMKDVLMLCNALKCDLDYFFTDMPCTTHDIQFIHDYTGLSQGAIERLSELMYWHNNKWFPASQDDKFDVINLILSDTHSPDSVSSLLNLLVGFCRFDITDSNPLYTVDKGGITPFQYSSVAPEKGIAYNPIQAHFRLQDMESMYYLKIWDSIKELKKLYQEKKMHTISTKGSF